MRSPAASVDLEELPTFTQAPVPPPPRVRDSYASVAELCAHEVPPPPPPPRTRASLASLQGLEDLLQDAFFVAGEEMERAYEAQARAFAGLEEELTAFIEAARRRRLRSMVIMFLIPMLALALVGISRFFAAL